MRRPLSAICSVITGAALVVLPVAHAQAAQSYQVRIWGTIELGDDENWPYDDERRLVDFDKTVTLSDAIKGDTITVSECVGGEVRADLTVVVNQTGDGQNARLHAQLFEGSSCDNTDQDGLKSLTMTTNSAANGTGDTSFTAFRITNESEDVPDDFASFNVWMSAVPV